MHIRAQKLYRPILPLAYWYGDVPWRSPGAAVIQRSFLPRDWKQWHSNEYGAAVIFVFGSILAIGALNSFTAIELRFNVFAIGALCVFGIDALLDPTRTTQRLKLTFYALVAGSFLAVCSEVMIRTYGTAGPLENLPQVTLSPLRCYTFASEASQ